MNQIKLGFVANNGLTYTPETEIGKQLGYITWTPSKLRIERTDTSDLTQSYTVYLSQNSTVIDEKSLPKDIQKKYEGKIVAPTVQFYKDDNGKPSKEPYKSLDITIPANKKYVDIYVGGKFQAGMLYGGASPEEKDIEITANSEEASIMTMIRVRRNANELTKKAKEDYLHALSEINKRDEEGIGLGVYSTDFFQMHIKGSKSIAHGSSVFLPWHRLYLLDLERTLQEKNANVSLHYWKFDEAAPNIFKANFLGETISDKASTPLMHEGFGYNFAKFSVSNPLNNWSIGREKLIRRKTWFDNQAEQSGYNKGGKEPFYLKDEYYVYHKNDDSLRDVLYTNDELPYSKVFTPNSGKDPDNLDSFTGMELNPHGEAHTSINGFLNYVPTAPKDPLFFFLHSNVDRLWAQWQLLIKNGFDYKNENSYKEMPNLSWTRVDEKLWPWNRSSTPNNYHMIPPGTRAENFSKSFSGKVFPTNVPKISDAIDAFGIVDNENNLGFSYDTFYNDVKSKPQKLKDIVSKVVEHLFANQSHIPIPNIVHSSNNRLLSKIVSDNANLIDASIQENETLNIEFNSQKNFSDVFKDVNLELRDRLNLEMRDRINFFVDLSDYSKHLRDVDYLESAHNYDINLLGEVEHQFDIISLNAFSEVKISKSLIFYILAIINNEKIEDGKIVKFIQNNIGYFSNSLNLKNFKFSYEKENSQKISDKTANLFFNEMLDLKIVIYSFASNSTIKDKIIPLFFPNENGLTEYLKEIKSKSEGTDSLSNKYWALYTLLTNAGVGSKKS